MREIFWNTQLEISLHPTYIEVFRFHSIILLSNEKIVLDSIEIIGSDLCIVEKKTNYILIRGAWIEIRKRD